ncbi:hypothetical protein [Capybara microvirus Cap1_SP_240]|nr:hypothetical protein [Capybara microvirus Cap1_SP_240]
MRVFIPHKLLEIKYYIRNLVNIFDRDSSACACTRVRLYYLIYTHPLTPSVRIYLLTYILKYMSKYSNYTKNIAYYAKVIHNYAKVIHNLSTIMQKLSTSLARVCAGV